MAVGDAGIAGGWSCALARVTVHEEWASEWRLGDLNALRHGEMDADEKPLGEYFRVCHGRCSGSPGTGMEEGQDGSTFTRPVVVVVVERDDERQSPRVGHHHPELAARLIKVVIGEGVNQRAGQGGLGTASKGRRRRVSTVAASELGLQEGLQEGLQGRDRMAPLAPSRAANDAVLRARGYRRVLAVNVSTAVPIALSAGDLLRYSR